MDASTTRTHARSTIHISVHHHIASVLCDQTKILSSTRRKWLHGRQKPGIGGVSPRFQDNRPKTYILYAVSLAPGHAVSCTLAPLRPSPLPIANYRLPIPSFVFAATAASKIDVVPHSPAHPAQSSPPLSPIQPSLNKEDDAERNAREIIARLLNDYLEAHPEPITGAIDNPFPFADKYGIKGISILSVFFDNLDMDTFTCRFCYDQHESVDDALEHQRTARHYS